MDEEEDQEEDEEDEDEQMEEDARGAHMPLLDVALEPSGSKLLLRLLAGVNDDRSRPRSTAAASTWIRRNSSASATVPASKKNPGVRREELAFLQEPVLEMVANHTPQLLASRSGSAVVLKRSAASRSRRRTARRVARAGGGGRHCPVVYEHAMRTAC